MPWLGNDIIREGEGEGKEKGDWEWEEEGDWEGEKEGESIKFFKILINLWYF